MFEFVDGYGKYKNANLALLREQSYVGSTGDYEIQDYGVTLDLYAWGSTVGLWGDLCMYGTNGKSEFGSEYGTLTYDILSSIAEPHKFGYDGGYDTWYAFELIYEVGPTYIAYRDQNSNEFSGTHESGYSEGHTYGIETTLDTPTRVGYTFDGWYLNDPTCTDSTAKVASLSANTVYTTVRDYPIYLYAKWVANTYSITYVHLGDLTSITSAEWGGDPPTSFAYDTETSLLIPSKVNYSFDGWHIKDDCSDDAITVLSASTYSDNVTLYGKWTCLTRTLALTCDNFGSQQYMIYIYSGDTVVVQISPTKQTETITLAPVTDYATTPYKVCFVFGYFGNITFDSLTNATSSGRNVTITTFANTTINYTIATPQINSSIMI